MNGCNMTNEITPKEPRSLDEFENWTDEVESHDEQVSERAIIGQRVRFTDKWLLPDQTQLTKPLIVVNVRRTVLKWGKDKKKRPETIFLKAGEKIPDLKKRNDETPKAEWVEGFDGKPKGPWETQHIVYMIDPTSIDQYSFPTSTTGGGIAIRELIDRIMWMRRFRGSAVYPVVQLATRFMPTNYSGRLRPHFEIVDWAKFDPGGGMIPVNDLPQPPPQQPADKSPEAATDRAEKIKAVLHAIGMQTVEPPSAKEATDDEIKF
jgi:hypothetical protein